MNVSAFETAYLSRVNTIMQSEEINIRVASALRFIVQNVFAKVAATFVFTLSTSGGATEFWLHDLMNNMFSTWGLIAVRLVVLDSKTGHVDVPGNRYCNMVMVDAFESLEKANIAEYNRNLDSFEYYIIFLQTPDEQFEREANKIFRYCFENYWIHCNIIAQNSKGDILVYTYFPFQQDNCFTTQPKVINRFLYNKFEKAEMFPDKLKDLQGCPLKLSTWETKPFVIKAANKRMPNLPVAGLEIFTLINLSKKMNFTLDVEWLAIETYAENKSPETAPLSKLENYDTNFTMGYFRRTATRDQIATPTHTTYYLPLTMITLRKEARHENMSIWTFPFDNCTWIMILVAYIFIGLLYVFENMQIKNGIFEIFKVIIGTPVSNLPNSTSTRIKFMTAITSSFILRSIYQSLLFYIFRRNYYQSIPMTLETLAKDGYTSVATELTLRFLTSIPQIEDKSLPLVVINSTSEMNPLRKLQLYRNESLVAISIIEFAIRFIREELAVGDGLQILPINVNDQQICFYLPKHSYLTDRLNDYILRIHQAGLYTRWREWILFDYKVVEANSSITDAKSIIIDLRQLDGFLFLVVLILLASTLVFSLELMSKKIICMQKLF